MAASESSPIIESEIVRMNHEAIDRSDLGNLLAPAYDAALRTDPRLANVDILPVPPGDERLAYALAAWNESWIGDNGRHHVYVRLSDTEKTMRAYAETMEGLPFVRQYIARSLGIAEDEVTPELLYVQSFLHEAGHAAEYMDYDSGDELAKRAHDEKARLPLAPLREEGRKRPRLLDLMNPESATRQDERLLALQQQLGGISVVELVEREVIAYRREVTSERLADEFAARVLTENPELLGTLTRSAAAGSRTAAIT